MVNLGSAGDSNTMVKLHCELMPHGWKLIREGWREGLPKDKPPKWTFCPLLKFPRDRVLVEDCKKCLHFKGISHSLERMGNQQKETTPFKVEMIPAKKKTKKDHFTKEQLEQEKKEKIKQDREWEEEEKKMFGDKNNG